MIAAATSMSATELRSDDNLLFTLETALTQCRKQCNIMEDDRNTIKLLREENEQLKSDLKIAQDELEKSRCSSTTRHTTSSGNAAETATLFRKYVETKAELDRLKEKESRRKSLKRPAESSPGLSPVPAPTTSIHQENDGKTVVASTGKIIVSEEDEVPARSTKRQRLDGRPALKEISPNTAGTAQVKQSAKIRSLDRKIAAIPALTEDGDDSMLDQTRNQQHDKINAHKNRLPGLLETPVSNKMTLDKLNQVQKTTRSVSSSPNPVIGLSSVKHVTKEYKNGHLVRVDPGNDKVKSINRTPKNRLERVNLVEPEDEEPFSAKPLHKLAMYHFKPNKAWLNKNGMSINDFLQGENGERIRALASTLPQRRTDDELLKDFLGPGSESKIASMTRTARENLVAEAKLKHVAMSFGSVRQDHDQRKEMPGYWSAEFPNTQEEKDDRSKAKRLEREEVKRRYDDARTAHGKWVFADQS